MNVEQSFKIWEGQYLKGNPFIVEVWKYSIPGGSSIMSMYDNLRIRTMRREELQFAVDLAAGEGWNPGIHDAESFYHADPEGFFLGEIGGEPVGCIAAVAYTKAFGYIGLYVVRQAFRGKNIGWKLWCHALDRLGDRNIGLDGVVEQQADYRRSGFRLAYRNVRYEGSCTKKTISEKISVLSDDLFEDLVVYDSSMFRVRRPAFLKKWINQPEGSALCVQRNNRIIGYGVIRRCLIGYKIGPLFADDAQTADDLFVALNSEAGDGPVFIDIPDVNPDALALVNRHCMKEVFETARMYKKRTPPLHLHRIYGGTTFEVG